MPGGYEWEFDLVASDEEDSLQEALRRRRNCKPRADQELDFLDSYITDESETTEK